MSQYNLAIQTTRQYRNIRKITRISAIAEGQRDASCQLKSYQLPRNSAETTCTASSEQIEAKKLDGYSGTMCNKHVHSLPLNREAPESLSLSYRCHKQTDDG